MLAICKIAPQKGLEIQDVPPPQMGGNDVRIKVLYAGVCGTDMHIYQWDDWAEERVKPPLVLGHEFVGEVVEIGKNVTDYQKGQLVSAECHIVCGVCPLCTTNQMHLCPQTEIIGVDRRGAFCEEVVMPQQNLWPISKGIAPKSAAIFDPLGNAMHTVMTHPVKGQHVLITGAGTIGLAATAMAKANGAKHITVLEPNTSKHALAKELGADVLLTPQEDLQKEVAANPPTILLEMSGQESAITQGLKALQLGGKAALLGIPSGPLTFDLAQLVVFKGLTLQGVVGREMFKTWGQVDKFVKENPHVPEKLISHTFLATDYQKAFECFAQGKTIKTVLDFTDGGLN